MLIFIIIKIPIPYYEANVQWTLCENCVPSKASKEESQEFSCETHHIHRFLSRGDGLDRYV